MTRLDSTDAAVLDESVPIVFLEQASACGRETETEWMRLRKLPWRVCENE